MSDNLSPEEAWQDLVEKDDRTSPSEYPEMCLITFEELRDYMCDATGTHIGITVGGGLSVYGTSEAIHRVQNYILLDSTHPVEKEDVRRALARDLQAAEAKIVELDTRYASLAAADGEYIASLKSTLIRARDQFRYYAEQHRAKGTEDGDAKAKVNDEMAAACDEAVAT